MFYLYVPFFSEGLNFNVQRFLSCAGRLVHEYTIHSFVCKHMAFLSYHASNFVIPVPSSQAEIDDEIAALTERMRFLRTHRNSLSSISSIPPEILGTIFVHLAHQVQSIYPPDSTAVLSWLKATHVCRHWREVAIANPHLWATPYLNSLKATEEMLMRSKMAPLMLRTGRRYRMECVHKAFEHAERFQEVSFECSHSSTNSILALLDKLSSCSAPHLRSLSLDAGLGLPRIAIPTAFHAPNLRRLQISHCGLSWTCPVLTGITVLDIKHISAECLPSLDELVSALRRMQALHTLSLDSALPTLPRGTKSLPHAFCAPKVRLPRLERLRLVGKMTEVANVLACVELPVSTRWQIQIESRALPYGNSNQEWNLSLPIISRVLESCFKAGPGDSRRIPRSMRLSARNHLRFQYGTVLYPASWAQTAADAPMEWSPECPATIDFGFPGDGSKGIIKKLWKLVPLGRLEALYVEDYPHPCWDGFWIDILGRTARNLSHLHVRGASQLLEDLFKSLCSPSRKHSVSRAAVNRSRPIFCPALSHLVLEYLEFTTYMTWMQPLDLRDVLIDRVNDGRGLEKLTITGCSGITTRDVQLLREVVVDVEWDDIEDSGDYDFDYDDYEYDSFDDDNTTHYSFYSNYSGAFITF